MYAHFSCVSSLHLCASFEHPGPLVTMMGKMVKNMIYFVVLLLVVLLSFGVSRQSILYPNEEASWSLIRDVSMIKYISIYHKIRHKRWSKRFFWTLLMLISFFYSLIFTQPPATIHAFNDCSHSHPHAFAQVYFQPYFMLYGEVFAAEIDPPCGIEGSPPCITGTYYHHYLFPSIVICHMTPR